MHPNDRHMATEVCATLSAVFDLAVSALAADSPAAVAYYRQLGEANLQVAARLLEHLARGGKIRTQAPAAGAAEPSSAAERQAPKSSRKGRADGSL